MHHPATAPYPSIYFNYQVYPSPLRPVRDLVEPVVVVGAGPVGLTTALLLARAGVRCVVLAAERQVCEGSRAIVFTRRSLEILQQTGAHTVFDRLGLPWTCGIAPPPVDIKPNAAPASEKRPTPSGRSSRAACRSRSAPRG